MEGEEGRERENERRRGTAMQKNRDSAVGTGQRWRTRNND